ncbi:MAG: methyl-accepting chemotaxis protein [Endomicrobia bacterium]|nr:methyl-accepting chemotaxis protein [Endomicrobiia bacterium]MCL2799314.1 methyl-accepting chemotaxis protein [Endomicrobiia bacterium]
MLRKKYFVKPKMQWRYLLILMIIMIILGVLSYYAFLKTLVSAPGMEQLSAGTVKNFTNAYTNGFFWIILAFSVFVLVQSVFYFHRIIGPMYFFELVMKKLSEGNFGVKVHWRSKDETVELANLISKVIENTRKSVISDREKLNEAIKAIDNGENQKAKDLLKTVTQWCKTEEETKEVG